MSKTTGEEALMVWCKKVTESHSKVFVDDFDKSWRDGLALCALLHTFHPERIPFDKLTPDNPEHNLKLAITVLQIEILTKLLIVFLSDQLI